MRLNRSAIISLTLLLWGTLLLYAPTIEYGFIWDDPIWYGHVLGKSWQQTLLPMTDFQFFRPLTMLYMRLFLRSDGSFAVEMLHWVQIGWHLLNVCLIYALGRRSGLSWGGATAAAAALALFPFAYQATAWAAPGQPMAGVLQNGAWLTYLIARQTERRPLLFASFFLFGAALLAQESGVAAALTPLLYEFLLQLKINGWPALRSVLRRPAKAGWLWALAYPLAAVLFSLVWLAVPRKAGITTLALQPETAAYLAQVFIYPLIGRPWGYDPAFAVSNGTILSLAAVSLAALLLLARRRGRGRLALFSALWTATSLAPAYVGLDFSYVSISERLLYAPVFGVNLLWVAAFWPEMSSGAATNRRVGWSTHLGATVCLLILAQSLWVSLLFAQMYRQGTEHLGAAVRAMGANEGRYLFINFPDQYWRRRPFYPVGTWGVMLAPVVVNLADFLPVVAGRTANSTSRSLPWIDAAARDAAPYLVNMRGVITPPEELYDLAKTHDAVYLTHYLPDGGFQLQFAGRLRPGEGHDCQLAYFGDIVCLQAATIKRETDQIVLNLAWFVVDTVPPHATIFTHLGQPDAPPLAQVDGDAWLGMLPLQVWQPGDLIEETRVLPLPSQGAATSLQIGVYNWVDGQRWPGVTADDSEGNLLPYNAYQMIFSP